MYDRSPSKVEQRNYINIVLCGEPGVGKSSFVIMYCQGKYETFYVPTIQIERATKKIKYNDKQYDLNFTVTSGNKEFQEDYSDTYKNVDFFLMFYDITSRKTYEKIKTNIQDNLQYYFRYKDKSVNLILVGNKCEENKKREVTTDEALKFCAKNNISFFEINVKSSLNIMKVIHKILETFDDMSSAEDN